MHEFSLCTVWIVVVPASDFCRVCESRGSWQEEDDDGAGMHEFSLCTVWIVVVPACDPKDLFIELVTMFTTQSIGLIWVGLVE
jgi:hypothetical protein